MRTRIPALQREYDHRMSPRPVYWKPKYGTRSSRHRAWVRQQAQREASAQQAKGPSLWQRLARRFRGNS
jgi:hypothetical protein